MNEELNRWLSQRARIGGIQACGLRHPDQTTFTEVRELEFTREALENAWRCADDLFHVARHQGLPAAYVRWSFDQSSLHCLTRSDGTCLMAFISPKASELDVPGLEALLEDFMQARTNSPPDAAAPSGPTGA